MESPFSKIVGGNKETREEFERDASMEASRTGEDLFGEYLVEPNENEAEIIKETIGYSNNLAAKYGSIKFVDPSRVFLLKENGVEMSSDGMIRDGIFNSLTNSIGVDRSPSSNVVLAMGINHEALHMSSYQAAQLWGEGGSGTYRSGIEMVERGGGTKYFKQAQEAIIAILNKKFFDEFLSKDPRYIKEIEYTKAVKERIVSYLNKIVTDEGVRLKMLDYYENILVLPDAENLYERLYGSGEYSNQSDAWKIGFFENFLEEQLISGKVALERQEEIQTFNIVLDDIIKKSEGKIVDREKLFDEFARAHFTGNYLPLARIIEDACGKGYFREIAARLS